MFYKSSEKVSHNQTLGCVFCFFLPNVRLCAHNKVVRVLQFGAVAQVASIAKARHDIFVLVQSGVDGRCPDGSVLGEGALDVLNALGSCYHARHVHVFGHAFRGEGLEAHLH